MKKGILLALSGALLISGSALLIQQAKLFLNVDKGSPQSNSPKLSAHKTQVKDASLDGVVPADAVDNYTFRVDGKDTFNLLLANYKDPQGRQQQAVLFPKGNKQINAALTPTELRQTVWEEAAKAIKAYCPQDALIVSWWDDGQRVHFLGQRDSWINKPGVETFDSEVWKLLQDDMEIASAPEREKLVNMARWFTMDNAKALSEMRRLMGTSRPVYILVTNDLLLRLAEIADYGGAPLALRSTTFKALDDLHGDIARIKQWAAEEGDGNYLVQKEGLNYRVWATSSESDSTKNALLIRLLPFVDSLKKLPDNIHLVYQSHWGGYLSIYQLNLD